MYNKYIENIYYIGGYGTWLTNESKGFSGNGKTAWTTNHYYVNNGTRSWTYSTSIKNYSLNSNYNVLIWGDLCLASD